MDEGHGWCCAMVCSLFLVALLLWSVRLDVERPVTVDVCDCFCQWQSEKQGAQYSRTGCSLFLYRDNTVGDMATESALNLQMAESLLFTLMDVGDVLINAQFIVQVESKVFEMVNHLNRFNINADGIVGYVCCCSGVADYKLLGFTYVKVKIVVCVPLCQVRDEVFIFIVSVIVIEECKYGCVIRIFEVWYSSLG